MNLDYKESLGNCEPKTLGSRDLCATESRKQVSLAYGVLGDQRPKTSGIPRMW